MSGYLNIPGGIGSGINSGGNFHWKGPVADFASLPVGADEGDVRLTLDTLSLYAYDGAVWSAISGGGSPGAPDTSIQYNSSGVFTGSSDLIYNGSQVVMNVVDSYGGLHVKGRSGGEASLSLHPDDVGDGDPGQWILYTGGNNTDDPEDFSIYNSGISDALVIRASDSYVGIGTYTPGRKLDISGDFRVQGSVYNNNNLQILDLVNNYLLDPNGDIILDFSDPSLRATAGTLRLLNDKSINWRNNANTGNLGIKIDTSDRLNFNANLLQSKTFVIPDSSGFVIGDLFIPEATIPSAVTGTTYIFEVKSHQVTAADDYTSLFGFGIVGSSNGMVMNVASGKTVDLAQSLNSAIQISASSSGGTLTSAYQYSAGGIQNQGGTLTITDSVGYQIAAGNNSGATNMWGIRDDSTAENYLNKLAINTATKKVSAGTVGLEIENQDLLVTGTGNVRISGNLGVGNSAPATTPGAVQNKIEIFDASGVSLGFIAVYDSIT